MFSNLKLPLIPFSFLVQAQVRLLVELVQPHLCLCSEAWQVRTGTWVSNWGLVTQHWHLLSAELHPHWLLSNWSCPKIPLSRLKQLQSHLWLVLFVHEQSCYATVVVALQVTGFSAQHVHCLYSSVPFKTERHWHYYWKNCLEF